MNRWVSLTIAITIVGLVAGAAFFGYRSSQDEANPVVEAPPTVPVTTCNVQQTITAPGIVVNTHRLSIEMPADGQLEEITVRAGDHVEAGDLLARVADREKYVEGVASAELDLLQAQKELDDLNRQADEEAAKAQLALANGQKKYEDANRKRIAMDYPHTRDDLVIENAKTDYELAKIRYKEALRAYHVVERKPLTNLTRVDRLKELLAAKQEMESTFAIYNWYILKPSQLEVAQTDGELALAIAELDKLEANWEKARQGPEPLYISLAEAKVRSTQARLDSAQKLLQEIEIRAPFTGIITEVKISPDESTPQGTEIIVLEDPAAVEIEATVLEEDYPYLSTGQMAEVFFDALPEAEATGELARIVPLRAPGERPLYYIYITLDENPTGLVPGMTADAAVILAKKTGVLCLPRAVVQAPANGNAQVEVWVRDHTERRSIQIGLRGDTQVEILSGLQEGDQVISR
jgi:multidrug efflux pump subunit AcrA (membrane-fusion protein)